MYMVPLMFMGMFMHVHACSCMLNSGCPCRGQALDAVSRVQTNFDLHLPVPLEFGEPQITQIFADFLVLNTFGVES